jgi:hypothetical protein
VNAVWGIRWDREDDRCQRLLMAAALVAVLAAIALLLISRGPAQVAMHAVIVRAEPNGLAAAQRALDAAAPSPDAARQLFAPAQIRGVVAVLVAHLSTAHHADVAPVGPDGSSWGGAKWGGSSWGGSSWGGSSWGGSSWGGSSWGGSSWGGASWASAG